MNVRTADMDSISHSELVDKGVDYRSKRYISYPGLVDKGAVNSRMTLWRMIREHGFPAGLMITPNRRVWAEDEVDAWIASRPTAKKLGTPKAPVETVAESASA
jgi:predicted DNA-binding transcriptional regulator AlpA